MSYVYYVLLVYLINFLNLRGMSKGRGSNEVGLVILLSAMGLICFLLFLLLQQMSAGIQCIRNYGELKETILNNTENQEDLLFGFYPPNQSPSHIITVYYFITPLEAGPNATNPNYEEDLNATAASYTFQWVDSSTLLLMEWRLFDALSFSIAELKEYNMSIIVSPGFCDESEAVKLLNMATIWVRLKHTQSAF